jgi:PKD repeat protein
MRINTSTQWILALLLFFANIFTTQSQTLDATFYSQDSSQCIGSTYVLLANDTSYQNYDWTVVGPNNFLWNSNGTYPYTSLILNDEGFYNVSLTVSGGGLVETNTIESFFNVNSSPLPTVNVTSNLIACSGDSILLSASGDAISYIWNDSIPNNSYVSFPPGNYFGVVTATNAVGCFIQYSYPMEFLPNPFAIISTDTSWGCSPLTVQIIQNSISLSGIGIESFEYMFSDDNSSIIVNDPDSIISHTFNQNGINYVSLKVTDSIGCIGAIASIPITIDNIPCSDTIVYFDNVYQDSSITGYLYMEWTNNCTFNYSDITGTTIDYYQLFGDSLIVNWMVQLNNSNLIPIEVTYLLSPGTTGVYEITLNLYCLNKSVTRFLSSTSRLYIENTTNDLHTNQLVNLQLYPNPTKSTLSISGFNSEFSYKISDLQGKLLKQGANEKQIDIENLPAGAYTIGISTDSEVKQLRFVKL